MNAQSWGSVGIKSGIGTGVGHGLHVAGPIVRHGGGGGIAGIPGGDGGGGGGLGGGQSNCPPGCGCHPAWYFGTSIGIILLLTAIVARA